MKQAFTACENYTNEQGYPAGGLVLVLCDKDEFRSHPAIHIRWQDGPLGRGEDRQAPNGAFVETVIDAALQRLRFYEEAAGGQFQCEENAGAIEHLTEALRLLEQRTARREAADVEGTHVGN